MPRILIVDSNPKDLNDTFREKNGVSLGEGYAKALFTLREDIEIVITAPYDGEETPDPSSFDGIVFTGSGTDWNTDDDRAEPLAKVMRDAFSKRVPAIGSCNGMQLAASVLGGSSDASPNGREDGIARDIRLTEAGRGHPMMAGRRNGYAVPCIHRDEVRELPNGAILLAGNAHSPVQAFAYERDGIRFWGMQYHPEFTPADVGRSLLDGDRVPNALAEDLIMAGSDPMAAKRVGTTPEEQAPETRMLELKNWLDSL